MVTRAGSPAPAAQDLRSLAFDRLGSSAVILDQHGVITATNEAWQTFSHLNGGTGASTGVGVSYLDVCDRAAVAGDRIAAHVADGLRRILIGEAEHFDVEYPCASLTHDGWVRLEASGAAVGGKTNLVLLHADITAHKRVQELQRQLDEKRGTLTADRLPWTQRSTRASPSPRASSAAGPETRTDLPAHHRAVLEALGEGVLVQDTVGRVLYVNELARELVALGPDAVERTADEPAGVIIDEAGTPMPADQHPGRRALREGRAIENCVMGLRSADGKVRWLEISSHPMTAPGEITPYAVVSALRDITERREADHLLAVKARLLDSVGQAVVAWDTDGLVTFVNAKAEELFGWSRTYAVGQQIAAVVDVDETAAAPSIDSLVDAMAAGLPWEGELLIGRSDGTSIPVWSVNTPILERGKTIGHIGVSKDISERKLTEARLDHLISHDPLTDLPTRRHLEDLLAQRLAGLGDGELDSVLLVDIGTLDLLNDAFSHATGDAVVLRCADLLRRAVHVGDELARFSDHVFAICCTHAPDIATLATYAETLRHAMSVPFEVAGIDIHLPASASAVATDAADCGAHELIRQADTALVRARRDRSTRVYDASMQADNLRRLHMGSLVDRILATDSLTMGYQPIVRLSDQVTVGAEALLRVVDEGEPVPPLELVEAAERSGRIAELGALILRTACTDAAAWPRAASGRPMTVSVNLSGLQLDDPSLARRVESVLATTGLAPTSLCLEITEGALMVDPARAADQLRPLRDRGIRFAADDFGTGYSSLSYLKALPLDALKIDQSFVAGIPENLEDVAITQAVLAMADALGLSVTAEGVETEQQLGALLELGTDFGQGYLWGKAMPSAVLVRRVIAETDASTSGALVPAPTPWRVPRAAPLGSAEERIDSILGIIAHEIRTPLSVVVGYARILQDSSDPERADAAAAIGRAAQRITRILTNIVDLSGENEADRPGDVRVIDAASAVAEAMHEHAVGCTTLRPPVHLSEPILIKIDVVQFAQVVTNLLSNAAKFSPPGSPIDVAVTQAGGWVDISVTDRGPGIAADDLGLVFRKYGRTDPLGNGTGLGLYLARQIARSHGGDILYRRGPDTGSIFVLRLPLETGQLALTS